MPRRAPGEGSLPDRKAIGERLRLARQAKGWLLREFAERINQAYQTVAAWGTRPIGPRDLAAIIRAELEG